MRKAAVGVFLVFMFSIFSPTGLFAATKLTPPKIDIKKATLESEVKGAVPSGIPLMVLVEVGASEDLAGPFAVTLELKKGKDKHKYQRVSP